MTGGTASAPVLEVEVLLNFEGLLGFDAAFPRANKPEVGASVMATATAINKSSNFFSGTRDAVTKAIHREAAKGVKYFNDDPIRAIGQGMLLLGM